MGRLRSTGCLAACAAALIWYASAPLAQPATDPRLVFSTYLGGTGAENVTVVRTDQAGNMYVAGATRSVDFPVSRSLFPPPNPPTTFEVGFLTKLTSNGVVVYSTYLPRPVVAMTVDAAGNAIVVDNLPIPGRGSTAQRGVVVSKIDPNGAELLYQVRLAGTRTDQATAIAADDTGAVVVVGHSQSPDFPLVNQIQPIIQTSTGFDKTAFVTKLDALGRIVFSTGWGGSSEELASAVAIDRYGQIYVAGITASVDFITSTDAFQPSVISRCPLGSACADVFLTKFMPNGQSIVYSTLFGGGKHDTLQALAIDAAQNVYLAGITHSSDLPLRNARQTSCDEPRELYGCSAYLAKLNATGTSVEYSTYFGSQAYYVAGLGQTVAGIAVDPDGNLAVVGTTQGNDLPLMGALQPFNGGGPLFKSVDDGRSWTSTSAGLTGTGIWTLVGEGLRPPRLYAGTFGRVFHSEDQGRSWRGPREASNSLGSALRIAVDPNTPSTVYAADSLNGAQKSIDGGETWTNVLAARDVFDITVAPTAPSHVYAAALRGIYHSPNGGLTWDLTLDVNPAEDLARPRGSVVLVDPRSAETVYVGLSDSTNLRRFGTGPWERLEALPCPLNELVATADGALYARACGKLWRSTDQARSWRELSAVPGSVADIAVDPSRPNAIYIAASLRGLHRSVDRGETWVDISTGFDHDFRSIALDPTAPGVLYAGAAGASNAFVVRFDSSGALTFSTYLGGRHSTGGSVAVQSDGSIVVGGAARNEFPLVRAIQSTHNGANDAFLSRITLRP